MCGSRWEARHGAVTALRELLRLHGHTGGMRAHASQALNTGDAPILISVNVSNPKTFLIEFQAKLEELFLHILLCFDENYFKKTAAKMDVC
jgi:hypothetical protein